MKIVFPHFVSTLYKLNGVFVTIFFSKLISKFFCEQNKKNFQKKILFSMFLVQRFFSASFLCNKTKSQLKLKHSRINFSKNLLQPAAAYLSTACYKKGVAGWGCVIIVLKNNYIKHIFWYRHHTEKILTFLESSRQTLFPPMNTQTLYNSPLTLKIGVKNSTRLHTILIISLPTIGSFHMEWKHSKNHFHIFSSKCILLVILNSYLKYFMIFNFLRPLFGRL